MPSRLLICDGVDYPVPNAPRYDRVAVEREMESLRTLGYKNVTVSKVTPFPFAYFVTISYELGEQ